MNKKEFLSRWKKSKAEPEMFYLPVEDDDGIPKTEPLIIEIEIRKPNVEHSFFYTNSSPYLNYSSTAPFLNDEYDISKVPIGTFFSQVAYKDKNEKFIPINKNNCPDWFHKKPINYSEKTELKRLIKLSPVSFNHKKLFCYVDWGDGTISEWEDSRERAKIGLFFDGEKEFELYGLSGFSQRPSFRHIYEKIGTYFIKIYAEMPHLALNYSRAYSSEDLVPYVFKGVVQWGDLGFRYLDSFFSMGDYQQENWITGEGFVIKPDFYIPKDFSGMENVISVANMFWGSNFINSSKLSSDCMKAFPLLYTAYQMFYGSSMDCIFDYMFVHNKYLTTAWYMCAYSKISYIGSYALADLPLVTLDGFTYNYSNNHPVLIAGDSIFENCEYLQTAKWAFCFTESVGDNVFKNCKSLVDGENIFCGGSSSMKQELKKVGKSLFEGCENLQSIRQLFSYSENLEEIGENMFKGCAKIHLAWDAFYGCYKLKKIPEKLFYDIQYFNWTYDFSYIFYGWSDSFTMLEIGRDMFNLNFIGSLGINQANFTCCFYRYTSLDDNYNRRNNKVSGYAPEIWSVLPAERLSNSSGIFGHNNISYTDSSGRTITYINNFTNFEEIPKRQPWLHGPFEEDLN